MCSHQHGDISASHSFFCVFLFCLYFPVSFSMSDDIVNKDTIQYTMRIRVSDASRGGYGNTHWPFLNSMRGKPGSIYLDQW